jgi:hypothetical protein
MDVRIGVTQNPKEIVVEMADDVDREALKKQISDALGDDDNVLWLTDRRGRDVAVPAGKVAYIEVGQGGTGRYIGFGAG